MQLRAALAGRIRLFTSSEIPVRSGKDTGVDPGGTRCGAVISEGGELMLVECQSDGYHEKARAAVLAGPCRAQMALANGRLYARDNKKLVCWKMKK